jgi:hypothetical protein
LKIAKTGWLKAYIGAFIPNNDKYGIKNNELALRLAFG